ncbi:MAG: trypsin-like peptidase domain-containing protein [Thermodesulfobacteriota bacterium]
MANIAQPSVQSLLIEMQFNGQALSTGTAFVVQTAKGPHLITNRHNVTGRRQDTNAPLSPTCGIPNEIVIVHNRKNLLGQWVLKKEVLYVGEAPRWLEHPTLGAQADFVALPLTDLADVEIYPYDPANPGPAIFVGAADTVSVIGFPFGMTAGGAFAVWATGFLASEPEVDFNNLPVQLIDCRSRQGQSGSPVIAYRGGGMVAMADGGTAAFNGPVSKFIGIYSGRINAESDIGIVWKASAVQQLIASIQKT